MEEKPKPQTNQATIPKCAEEDEFWISYGQSLVSQTIDTLDDRAKFMITTSASLLVADFAVLLIMSRFALIFVSPQFFFAFSALFFIFSLFPRQFLVNPWTPDDTKNTYRSLASTKFQFHKIGFLFFFVALLLVALSSFSIALN